MRAQDVGRVFVGRDDELERLQLGLADVAEGRGELFLLTGEAGIGKTRLGTELAAAAEQRGILVLWGRCWESAGAPAYWPWVQVLRSYARQADPEALAARLDDHPDLLHLVPELRPGRPAPAIGESSDSEHMRFRLLDSTASFLRSIAAKQALLILLDDLHGADHSSLLMLRFLAPELRSMPVVVVGTYREHEAVQDPLTAQILADAARHGQRLPLRGISSGDVANYISAAVAEPVASKTVEAVFQVTEGNPLFVSEVVRLWMAERSNRGQQLGENVEPTVPEELRAAIRRRLSRFPDQVQNVLQVAAVLGREVDVEVLGRLLEVVEPALDSDKDALHSALEIARRGGLVQRAAASRRFSFEHMLIRDVLYEDLSPLARGRLHHRAATVLEQMHAADLAPHLAEIAHHYSQVRSGEAVGKTIEFARRAGDRAATMFAYEDAVRHFERGLAAFRNRIEGLTGGDLASRGELLLSLGDAYWGAGEIVRMRQSFLQAAAAARQFEDDKEWAASLLARAALGLCGWQQNAHMTLDLESVQLLEEAREELSESDSPLRARVLARLAYALYTRPGSYPRRAQLCRQAVDIARRVGDPGTLRRVLNDWRWALWGPDSLDLRLEIARELVEIARTLGESEMPIGEREWRLVDLLELGNPVGFDAELEAFRHWIGEQRRPWQQGHLARFEATIALLRGRFTEAERLAEEAFAAMQRSGHQDPSLLYGTLMLALRVDQGRLVEIEGVVRAMMAQSPDMSIWRYVPGYLFSELEQAEEARIELERIAGDDSLDLPSDYQRLAAGACLAETCAFVGDAERAARLYDTLRPYAEQCVIVEHGVVSYGSMSRYLGLLASTCGDREAASTHFEAAIVMNARLGARPALARTQLGYARTLLECGESRSSNRERAGELLRAAYTTATEIGMKAVERRAKELAARHELTLGADSLPRPESNPSKTVDTAVWSFFKEGEYWSIGPVQQATLLKHVRGFTYILHLLERPSVDVHVFDLVNLADGATAEQRRMQSYAGGGTGPLIDPNARAAYKQRLNDLREDLEEAENANDLGRLQSIRSEMDQLAEHLAAATGIGGRSRMAGSQANRARVAVAKAIRIALARIAEHQPTLALHLKRGINTGVCCSYIPDPMHPLHWRVGASSI